MQNSELLSFWYIFHFKRKKKKGLQQQGKDVRWPVHEIESQTINKSQIDLLLRFF